MDEDVKKRLENDFGLRVLEEVKKMEPEKQIELLRTELESSIKHVDVYLNQLDVSMNEKLVSLETKANMTANLVMGCMERILVIEREFNCVNETKQMLKTLTKELGLDDKRTFSDTSEKAPERKNSTRWHGTDLGDADQE